MRSFFRLLLLTLIPNVGVAQQKACQAGPAVTIEDRDESQPRESCFKGHLES
jgi:hypothetical protein